jgi:hypothetical protein
MNTSPDLPHLDGVEHRFVDVCDIRMHVAEAGKPLVRA